MTWRVFATLFVIGAVGLTLLDSIHVHTHTLAYVTPCAFGSAWWVPLLMGSAVSGGGVAYVLGWARLGGPAKVPTVANIARGALVFAALYAASGVMPVGTIPKLILITLGAIFIFWHLDGSRAGAILLLLGAVVGSTAEAINPGFHYFEPDVVGIPIWLPSLYGCAMPVVGQLARWLVQRETARRL